MNVNLRIDIDEADQLGSDIFFTAFDGMYGNVMPAWFCLEMFARDGSLTMGRYINFVRSVEAWELDERHTGALSKMRPRNLITGQCSYELLKICERKFDFIMIDSPQGIYPDGKEELHTEHFDIIPRMRHIMRDACVVGLYVNKEPYDRRDGSSQSCWQCSLRYLPDVVVPD